MLYYAYDLLACELQAITPDSSSRVPGIRLSSGSLYIGRLSSSFTGQPDDAVVDGYIGCIDQVKMQGFLHCKMESSSAYFLLIFFNLFIFVLFI